MIINNIISTQTHIETELQRILISTAALHFVTEEDEISQRMKHAIYSDFPVLKKWAGIIFEAANWGQAYIQFNDSNEYLKFSESEDKEQICEFLNQLGFVSICEALTTKTFVIYATPSYTIRHKAKDFDLFEKLTDKQYIEHFGIMKWA